MSSNLPPKHDSDDDPRITFVMEEYLAALEAGQDPSPAEYLERYPEIAAQLQMQLEGLAFLYGAAPDLVATDLATRDPHSNRQEPLILGDYRLIRAIGRGGMGVVYLAEQVTLKRYVAIKVLAANAARDARSLARFRNEAVIAGQLSHPHIVKVIDVGEQDQVYFFAMEYVNGTSLADLIALWSKHTENPSCVRQAAEYCRQVASALDYAHQLSVLHRDVKPSNIIVNSSGNALLTDFGLARFEDVDLTMSGDIVGTLRYMSPEQASGSRASVGPWSDIYSLGATLYELTTLKPMFSGDHQAELLNAVVAGNTVLPRVANPLVPLDLETIILTATRPDIGGRYSSAQAMADDLGRFLRHEPIRARRPSVVDRISKWARRHYSLALFGIVASLLLMITLAVSTAMVWHAQSQTQLALRESQRQTSHAEDLLYISDIQQAYQAWNLERMDLVDEILNRHLPSPEHIDRRGFEWHALRTMAKQPTPIILGRHQGAANEIAVFPGQRQLATAGDDGQVCIWSADSQQKLRTIDTGKHPIYALAISPDGQTIATGNFAVELWNASSGTRDRLLMRCNANTESIAFSPNGQHIVTGCRYDKLNLFSMSGELIQTVEGNSRFESLAFTPDGTRIIAPGRTPSDSVRRPFEFIRVWNNTLASVERDFIKEDESKQFRGTCNLAVVAPSGQFYAFSGYCDGGYTSLINPENGEVILTLRWEHGEIKSCAISTDERFLAAGFDDGTIDYWQLTRSDLGVLIAPYRKRSIQAHRGQVRSLKFLDGHRLVTCGSDGFVKQWSIQQDNLTQFTSQRTSKIAVGPNDTIVLAQPQALVRIQTDSPPLRLPVENSDIDRVAWLPNGAEIITSCNVRKVLELRSAISLQLLSSANLNESAYALASSPTQPEIAIASKGRIRIFKTTDLIERTPITFERTKNALAATYSHDGTTLAFAGNMEAISVINLATRHVQHRMSAISPTQCLSFDAKDLILASGHDDGSICLWDHVTGDQLAILKSYEGAIRDLEFSPNGQILASISSRGLARLWSVAARRELGVVYRGSEGWSIAFSPSGSTLYVGCHRDFATLQSHE